MASSEVVSRAKDANDVVAAIETHGAAVAERVAARVADPEKREVAKAGALALLTSGAADIEAAVAALEAADQAHEAELADDSEPRRVRDDAADAGRATLVLIKQSVAAVWGSAGLRALRLEGDTPKQADQIRAQLEQFAAMPGHTAMPARTNPLQTFDLMPAAQHAQADAAALKAALQAVAREEREAETTLVAKWTAMDAFDETYRSVVPMVRGLFVRAGERELADRLVPSAPSPSRKPAEPTAE